MPLIKGTWTRGEAPGGGRWTLTVPNRVTGLDGAEIIPKGVYETGDLVAADDGTWTLEAEIPSSAGTLPASPAWQPRLTVEIYDGETEVYVLDVSGTATIELGTLILPQDVDDPVPNLVRGVPGGLAALDEDGDVIDADGNKVSGGGAVEEDPDHPWFGKIGA